MLTTRLPEKIAGFRDEANRKGQSVVYLVQEQEVVAGFALADVIRPESKEAVAEELGIDTYFAEVLPEHKDQQVAELQRQGKWVVMVLH